MRKSRFTESQTVRMLEQGKAGGCGLGKTYVHRMLPVSLGTGLTNDDW
jgi:hypothetical protein